MTSLIQPTRILIVGGGGREHALAWKLGTEPGVNEVAVAPGSDAIAREARVRVARDVDPLDPEAIVKLARERAAELVVIGPEAPLPAGVADALIDAGIPVFGPTAAAARIESSKAFCREVAEVAGVPLAEGRSFGPGETAAAHAYASELGRRHGVVVKEDGLAAGKGVTVCDRAAVAAAAIDAIDGPLVIEERLVGPEASVIAICDGRTALALPAARDHKRLGDGDSGPNTGGMGAYSPLPDLSDEAVADIVERFHRPILAELARRGAPFRGALYAGLMLTSDGPRLLEFNARFGDPETQVIVPRLATALAPLLLAAARGRLDPTRLIPVVPGAIVGIVLASAGYPGAAESGARITALDAAGRLPDAPDVLVFHSGTLREVGPVFLANGGRVLTVVGRGRDLAAARAVAEVAVDRIAWPGAQRRHDIAAASAIGVPA
ncbi:MAG TPA: phosphoribosylamine--glycine ligase [Patescibacteria group bacterium]|nr:phosphoribosylamine--glycine ligase [Patescibacteria group bacterium]